MIHAEVFCDHPNCNDSVDGGNRGSTAEEAVERAVREYGWLAVDDKFYCEHHREFHEVS